MASSLRSRDMPTEFAVFPLPGALLLPNGRLPLNIFEPRYLNLVEDALGEARIFGMIQPDTSRVPGPSGPGLYRIGCVGRISSFSETEDGRFLVTLTGLTRFTMTVELETRRGYRRVRADLTGFAGDLDADAQPGDVRRDALLNALRAYFAARGFEANWDAINEMGDGQLVSTLAMVCPFEPAEKQLLLEAATIADRAKTLQALLEIGAHATGDDGPHPVS